MRITAVGQAIESKGLEVVIQNLLGWVGMLCTEDFSIIEVVKQTKYSGVVKVGARVSQDMADYFLEADELGISTRSRLARVFSDFYVLNEPPVYSKGMLTATLGYRNLHTPITYHAGDLVGRFYACNRGERITVNSPGGGHLGMSS